MIEHENDNNIAEQPINSEKASSEERSSEETTSGKTSADEKKKKAKKRKSNIRDSVIKGAVSCLLLLAFFWAGYLVSYFSIDGELRSLQFVYNTYKDNFFFYKDGVSPAKVLTEGLTDIYSEYYTADEYKSELSAGKGERKGYGIVFNGLSVHRVSGNSPAEKANVKKGDKIVGYKINDGELVSVDTLAKLTAALSAASDNDLLTLCMERGAEQVECVMRKADYRESYVYYIDSEGCYRFNDDSGKMALGRFADCDLALAEDWGYIKYTSFYGQTDGTYGSVGQMTAALDQMFSNGKTKLIIDLRDNGGGFMDIMCKLSGVFCPRSSGTSGIAQTAEYRNGRMYSFNVNYSSAKNSKGDFYSDKLSEIVFLANQNSASASEALMGAVLDYDNAAATNKVRVVLDGFASENGEIVYKTYGKGIMQSTFVNNLTGEALKLTTARIIWPLSGKCIHGEGITVATDSRVYNAVGEIISFAQTL